MTPSLSCGTTRLLPTLLMVKGPVHNILEKLALHTRLQIAAYVRSEAKSDPTTPLT